MFKTITDCKLSLISHSDCGDYMPCSAARVSFGNEDRTGQDVERDKKLMNYLAEHDHLTPFEYQHATFLIEVPLFIRSQIMRHRTFSYNEISRRYTSEELEFWVPDYLREQSRSNKQASTDKAVLDSDDLLASMRGHCESSLEEYERLVAYGVCREQARSMLPQSLLTKFYMGGNLRNWAHFVALRRDEHAQKEVQVVAERVAEKLRWLWPESCKALGI